MNLPANRIVSGAWSARWGDHVIHLQKTDQGWRATVWRWTLGGGLTERTQIDKVGKFPSARVATQWACGVLVEQGAKVFVDGKTADLGAYLSFAPAPEST